jgi:hypothetical protein
MEKLESSYTPNRNLKWYSHFGKYLAVPWKVKHRIIIWTRSYTPSYMLKRVENKCQQKIV